MAQAPGFMSASLSGRGNPLRARGGLRRYRPAVPCLSFRAFGPRKRMTTDNLHLGFRPCVTDPPLREKRRLPQARSFRGWRRHAVCVCVSSCGVSNLPQWLTASAACMQLRQTQTSMSEVRASRGCRLSTVRGISCVNVDNVMDLRMPRTAEEAELRYLRATGFSDKTPAACRDTDTFYSRPATPHLLARDVQLNSYPTPVATICPLSSRHRKFAFVGRVERR